MPKFLHQLRPSKDFGEKEYRKLRAKIIKKSEYKTLSHFFREKAKEYIKQK
jgi:hypothetical protein